MLTLTAVCVAPAELATGAPLGRRRCSLSLDCILELHDADVATGVMTRVRRTGFKNIYER
jgi:hypothetical protein